MPEKKKGAKSGRSLGTSAMVLAIAAAALTVFLLYVTGLRGEVVKVASEQLEVTARTGSGLCVLYINDKLAVLEHCAGEMADFEEKERITERISHYCTDHSFARIAFVRVNGDIVTSDGEDLEASIRILAQETVSSGSSNVYPNSQTVSNYDLYSVPVTDSAGNIRGALIGGCKSLDLAEVVLKNRSGFDGEYIIVNDSGRVLTVEKGGGLFEAGSDLVRELESGGSSMNEFKAALRQKEALGVQEITKNGESYLMAYSTLEGAGCTLLIFQPLVPLLESERVLYIPAIVIIISLIIIFIIVALRMVKLTDRTLHDVDEAIEDSRRMFYEDSVTGFGSWYKFLQDYDRQVKDTSQNQALLSLDIDNFKATNDMIGYDGGNNVLKQLAAIISRNIGKNDLFARISGDKFLILAGYGGMDELRDLAERMIADIGYQITSSKLTVSIGIYPITDRSVNAYTAADRADLARIRMKKEKESSYMFFDSTMLENVRSEHFIENAMEAALEKKEFLVYLQPKFALQDPTEVTGAEALVRWNHGGEIIPPGRFIPLFERNGFVTKLDLYMFREVCRLQKSWQNKGYALRVISVNMSRAHLSDPDFVDGLSRICREFRLDPKYLEIEITESAAFENIDILMKVFTQIKEAGFHVSIDDFGTGYSSLNMLKDLPVDVLKIDRSFLTEDANESENASKIIGCVVSLATSLNIATICEGIETQEQAQLLSKLGCNMAQGFFFARPLPVAEYEKLVYHTDKR